MFLINVLPIAVTLVFLSRLKLPEHPRDTRVGWLSVALYALGLGGVVLLLLFLLRQRSGNALMPLSLFRVRNFAWATSTLFVYARCRSTAS